jgi:MraZ protein
MEGRLVVLFGEYERTVDYKGRLTVPAHLLVGGETEDWSRAMVVKGEPGCLFVYDMGTWEGILREAALRMDDDEVRLFMHRAVHDAHITEVDNLKRISISSALLAHATIEKRTIVVGMFNHLELWEPERWSEYLETMDEVPVPTISDLSRTRIRQVS